jgi:hypothetical protein
MTSQYRCETCKTQDDCAEWKYTSVRDTSNRCGLVCHSDFQYPIPNDEQCRICQQASRKEEREKVLDELREIKEYDRIRFHQKHTLPKSWTEAKVTGVFKNGKRIGISAILPGSRCTTEMSVDVADVRYVCRWIELQQKDGE